MAPRWGQHPVAGEKGHGHNGQKRMVRKAMIVFTMSPCIGWWGEIHQISMMH